MANEFIARKGLIALDDSTVSGSLTINTSGSTVFDIQGSQGQLFSVTDSLTGTLMSVNDISGLPILEVSSDDKVVMGTFGAEGLVVTGSNVNIGKVVSNSHTVTGSLGVSGSFNVDGTTTVSNLSVTNLTASGNVKLGDATSDSHTITGSLGISGSVSLNANLALNNFNITGVNLLQFADPGPGEGIEWTGGNFRIYESPNDLTTNSAGNLQFVSGSTRVMTIGTDRTVNVANGELNITSSAANPTILLYDSSAGNDPYIRMVPSTTTNAFAIGVDDSDSDKFKISYGTNAALGTNDRLTIDTSGNVGIGTNAPLYPLHISQSNTSTGVGAGILIEQAGAGDAVLQFLLPGAQRWVAGIDNSDSDKFKIASSIDLDSNSRITIDTSGNVGIGTTSPTRALDVRSSGVISHFSSSTTQALVDIVGTSNQLRLGSFSGTVGLAHGTVTVPQLSLDSAGNVGIGLGTTAPSAALHISSSNATQFLITSGSSGSLGVYNNANEPVKLEWRGDFGASSKITGSIGIGQSNYGGAGQSSFNVYGERLLVYTSGSNPIEIEGNVWNQSGTFLIEGVLALGNVGGGFGDYRYTLNTGQDIGFWLDETIFGPGNHNTLINWNETYRTLTIGEQLSQGSTGWTEGYGKDISLIRSTKIGISSSQAHEITGSLGITGSTSLNGNIGAPAFTPGFAGSGWRLSYSPVTSSLEVDNLTVRGTMKVYELLINQIRATNGTLFISSVGKVDTVQQSGSSTTYYLTFDTGSGNTLGHGFLVGDIIRAQRTNPSSSQFVYRSDMTVEGVSGNGRIVTASLTGSNPPSASYEFVRLGNRSTAGRQGTVYLTADDTNAPFIDVLDGITSHTEWNSASGSNKLKTRMGKLDGINNTPFGNLTGYGFYASGSAYLVGGINAAFGNIGGFAITQNALTGSGFFISGGAASNGFFISSSRFNVKGNGDVTGSNVLFTGGRIGGFTITNDVLSGTGFLLSGSATGTGFFISASNFNVKANGQITGSNVLFNGGRIGGFTISNDVLSGTGFLLSGSATGTGFFISASNFNVKANGQITGSTVLFTGGRIGGFTITDSVLSGTGFLLSGSATGTGFFISASNFNVKADGQVTGSNVLFNGGRIGGFTITNDVLSGTGFLLSGSASSTGFFISSSGFNVKGSGNITASAGLVGGWNLSTSSLSQGNVNLLATAVSGGLFVTSGSERILTVGDFADVTVTTSPGLFATASLFRSVSNGTASIASSSNSITISRTGTVTDGQYVVTTVTQSLGTIQAGRVIALEYNYADLTTYTASAATVTWNNTSPLGRVTDTVSSATTTQTGVITPITASSTVSGVINGARGVVTLVVSSSFNQDNILSSRGIFYLTKGTLFLRDGSGNNLGTFNLQLPSTKGAIATTPVTASFNYASPTTIQFTGSYEWAIDPVEAGFETSFGVTSSLQIGNLASTLYIPAEFTASISSSGGTQLLNTFKNSGSNDSLPYSRTYADTYFVPTTVTDAKLILTVKQLGSGSAYANLPSYQISDILLSADLPKVNITRNQALFYNSPLQYMQWTTSSFDIKGAIDATSLTVRGTTNLLGPVNIEGDISSHPDIQGATSTNFTAGTVVQNLTFDEFGHTTGVSSTNLDSRFQPIGSYVTTNTAQTVSALKTIVLSSNPTLVLGTGPSAFSGSLEFRGTTIGGTQATSVIRIKPTAASNVVVDLPDAGGTMAMLEDITTSQITGTLPVNKGGTGATSFTNNRVLTGNGTSALVDEANLTFDGSTLTVTGAVTTTGNVKLGDTTSDAHTITGSLGVSGSLALVGSQTITTNLTIDGNAKLGNATSDAHTITGSLGVSGSLALIGNATSTGNVTVTGNISASGNLNIDGNTVIGNSGADTLRIYSNDIVLNKGGAGSPHTIRNDNASSDLVFLVTSGNMVLSGSSTSNMSFVDAGTTNMFISSSGNVGIGTTTPRTPLQVNGQISGSSVRAAYSSSDGTAGLTVTMNLLDDNSNSRTLIFKDGILVSYI